MNEARQTKAFPVVISGPSGVGKTTLVEALVGRDPLLLSSVSTTTRPPREGEKEGESYSFVDSAEFERLKKDQLIEWAQVHGHFYGTPRHFVDKALARGRDVVLNIDVQGGKEVKKGFPEAVLIFILPPSLGELGDRIRQRGTDFAGEIEKRLDNARQEIGEMAAYDYVVVNDDIEQAVDDLQAIIRAERCRGARQRKGLMDRL